MRRSVAIAVCALASTPAAAQARDTRLSDERTFTRTAEVRRIAPVRERPDVSARPVARLHRWTEDRFPETYLLLRRRGRWIELRVPGRPNGRTGWVRADALSAPRLTRWALVIDRERLRARLLFKGRRRWTGPVGVGAPGTPTPAGRFWVREKLRVDAPGGIYGPRALGTSAYSALSEWPGGGVVGIHGTNQPELIPGRPSHGCIRLRNRHIRHLARRLPIGAPVLIR